MFRKEILNFDLDYVVLFEIERVGLRKIVEFGVSVVWSNNFIDF